jgi:hypothetical protein
MTHVTQTARSSAAHSAAPEHHRVVTTGGGRGAIVPVSRSRAALSVSPNGVVTLSPVALAWAASANPSPGLAASPAGIASSAPPGGGGSSDTAFGLVALIGAGGIAVLRARQLASAAGVDDAGTLTALGHSASIFWAGSCYPLGSGTTAAGTMNASFSASPASTATALGGRARFGVRGAVSNAIDGAGSRVQPPAVALARDFAGGDRTGLVALLFAASAAIGAAFGALGPQRARAGAK